MLQRLLVLCLALLVLAGCESIFGKESGTRGSLPGKREAVFSSDRALKADPAVKSQPFDLPPETDLKDWPFSGGSVTRAHGALALSANPTEAWSVSIGSGSGDKKFLTAQPVIGDGKVFTIDTEAHVKALSAEDGSMLWEQDIPNPRPEDEEVSGSGAGYAQGKLIATTNYGHVVVMEVATGKILWQKTLPAPVRSSPVVEDGQIYITATNNVTYNLSLADGHIDWTHTGVEETAALMGMAAPLPNGEVVIAPFSSGQVVGIRKLNGGTVWEENLASATPTEGTLPAMSDIQGEPVLDDGRVYVGSHSGRLVALSARAGERLWESDAGTTETPWVAGKTLFVLTIENQLAALASDDGHVRWAIDLPRYTDAEDRTDPILWTGPVLAGGKLYLANSLGELHTYDPRSGKEIETTSTHGAVFIPLLAVGRTLYILSDDGTLTAYR